MNDSNIIVAIRNYFLNYTKFPETSLLNVDALPNEANNFSIDFTPCKRLIAEYLNGTKIKQQTFVLAGRFTYNNDNTVVLNFFEDLNSWIDNNNRLKIFPILGDKTVAEDMEVLSNGYLISQDGTEARYQIQLRLIYREEEI